MRAIAFGGVPVEQARKAPRPTRETVRRPTRETVRLEFDVVRGRVEAAIEDYRARAHRTPTRVEIGRAEFDVYRRSIPHAASAVFVNAHHFMLRGLRVKVVDRESCVKVLR